MSLSPSACQKLACDVVPVPSTILFSSPSSLKPSPAGSFVKTFFSSRQRLCCSASPQQNSCNGTLQLQVFARGGGMSRGPRLSRYPPPQQDPDAPPLNEEIRAPIVRLLGPDQSMLGTVTRAEALERAREANLDLLMIAPDADPPVVKIVEYSKYRFEQQKKKREQQKKAAANRTETKELKMRCNIDAHDYDVKLRAAQKFLLDGDRVKVTVQFRGREIEFKDLGAKLFERFVKDVGELGSMEGKPASEGRSMMMLISPNKVAVQKAKQSQPKDGQKKVKRKEEEKDGSGDTEASEEDGAAEGEVEKDTVSENETAREETPAAVGVE